MTTEPSLSDSISTRAGLTVIGTFLILLGLTAWGIDWPMRFVGKAGHVIDGVFIVGGGLLLWRRRRAKQPDGGGGPAA